MSSVRICDSVQLYSYILLPMFDAYKIQSVVMLCIKCTTGDKLSNYEKSNTFCSSYDYEFFLTYVHFILL